MRRLRRNLVSIYGVYAASALSGLVLTPIIVHALGTDGYGLWAFIGSLAVYLGLLDLGVGPSIVRFAAHHRGSGDEEEVSALASVGMVVYAAIGLVTALAGLALAWVVPLLVDVPGELVGPARIAAALVVAAQLARFPLGLYTSLLLAHQRHDVVNGANLVSIVLYSVAVGVLLTRGGGLVLLAGLTLGATVVRLALPLVAVRGEFPRLRMRRAAVSVGRVRELLAFSWHNLLVNVAAKVVFSADVIVVGIVLGAAAAAFYAIPAKLFALAFGVATAGTGVLYPALSELEGAADERRQRAYVVSGLRVGMALVLFVALPLALVPDLLIGAWIGEGFERSTWVMVLLAVALVLHQPGHLLGQYLIARGWQAPLARAVLAMAVANVALSIALAYAVGLWGVALATVATELVVSAMLVPRLAVAASGLRPATLARAALRPAVPALAVALVALVAVARLVEPDDLLGLVPIGVLWVVAFAPAVWRFGLAPHERAALAGHLAGRGRSAHAEARV